jgi:MFS family permease
MPDSTDFENLVDGRLQAQTYVSLLRNNREFRLFLTSYLITHCGEWLTYVASIALIEDILGNKISRTAIAGLVMTRLLPNVVLSCAGGVLADARDRRQSMILLDILGALSALLFLVAYHARSITVIYLVSLLQQCVAALYEPCRSAIVPLMVTNERDLKLATTLAGLAWSLMTAVGSALGGVVVAYMGYQACFGK